MAQNSDVPMQKVDECDREFVLALITLYRESPVLWDVSLENYTNKYKRHKALIKICESLKYYKPNYSLEELKRKLNILRTNFNKERSKIEAGGSTQLWYYKLMTFLNKNGLAVTRSQRRMPNFYTSLVSRNAIIRKQISDSATNDKEDEISTKYWAMKLRNLHPDQRVYAEKIINDTLFEGRMGTLTKHGVSYHLAVTWEENESPSKGLEVEIVKSRHYKM